MTQPNREVEQSQLDKAIEVLTLAALGAYIAYVVLSYGKLPEQVPSHFGPTGEPDAWEHKSSFFVLPAIALIMYILLTLLNKYPHLFNYPVKITSENAAFHYEKARALITQIKAVIVLMFFYISWRTIGIVDGKVSGLGHWFILILLLMIFLPIVFYFVQIAKAKKEDKKTP